MRNLSYATLVALLILAGCYPGGPEFVDELDIAISHFDPDYFNVDNDLTGTTFEMPDSVVYLKDGKENEDADHSKDGQLLVQIRDHMLANGFTEFVEVEGQEPNLIVAVISITSTQEDTSGIPILRDTGTGGIGDLAIRVGAGVPAGVILTTTAIKPVPL